MQIVSCTKKNIEKISKTISDGGIVVFPTDTVYGIGCNPYNKTAVERIYKIKQRDKNKPLPILAYSKLDLRNIVKFNESANKISEKLWPGQITLVLKLKDKKLGDILGLEQKIAVRVPNNRCILSILEKCKLLIGTSANKSGVKSFADPKRCLENVEEYDLFVDGGVIKSKGESTIVDLTENKPIILREGAIKAEEIFELI